MIDGDRDLSIATKDDNDLEEDEAKIPEPLHWFGVLVPAPLREAQEHFTAAVDQPLVKLANSARQIRHLENLVESQRKKIKRREKSANSIAPPS
jgi:coiled-coil domain-containing protein 115